MLKTFLVDTVITTRSYVSVETDGHEDEAVEATVAAASANDHVRVQIGDLLNASYLQSRVAEKVSADVAHSMRVVTFQCAFCGFSTPKNAWGLGHITCPVCKKQTLSPAEIAERAAIKNLKGESS